ncbi:hypothetical protein NKOR_03980 [Candidatus Nitrosopumilus koreensis AR1]|uniref:DUF922 domain-containing protein n=1 Tax=Candidatus Nitrosopumilus koreensis AR1 TaxID=1229908 RepID=K0B878_9ARCH|nr:hypothetical protein [Candidatus Nitrosopumilus koreensis]AFS80686.1 hypothetical protein NKOR_03980 [Candidatus Nitrosopumilus koreensis AR1]
MKKLVCDTDVQREPQVIIWNNTQILKWSDFKKKSDPDSEASANAAIGFESKPIIEYLKVGKQLKYKIKDLQLNAIFIPNLSWVTKNINLKEGNLLLKHEQGHFDLAEEVIRKIKNKSTGIYKVFTIKEKNKNNMKEATLQVNKIRDDIESELQNEFNIQESKYDNKTNHGLIKIHQKNIIKDSKN